MRLKKAIVIFISLITIGVVFMLYTLNDLEMPTRKSLAEDDIANNKWLHFEDKIKHLEDDLNKHHNAVYEIKEAVKNLMRSSSFKRNLVPFDVKTKLQVVSEFKYDNTCPFQINMKPKTVIQMLDLYENLNFDNMDGGVWKQGWRIEVDEKQWNRRNKLKVFVVPHSHNDPGWIKTFEDYYATQTKHILDNMLVKLPEDSRRKFIWAEVSFFSLWWDELKEDDRYQVERLIRNNQLEIVTGGWVMNDEANSHWQSILNQLTDGHQWLKKNLNYTPVSHWSIDPFGLSLTQPMLLKNMGLKNMLIQRVHYSVKKQLASTKMLEFRWRQLWDNKGDTEILTHMMPFYSYDIPHTCGPDPKICCQFDFKRLPNHGFTCPWRIPPQVITEKNVAERAELLLDQYRKKSRLFNTNVVLAPLGDDFRYDHPTEWDVQYNNYQKLFDYMNSNVKLNVQAQFGTLTDYFNELRKNRKISDFPTLSGDFFTYADRDDHYWSGYYTSRPFYKRMDRILLAYVKAAESIYTLTSISNKPGADWISNETTGIEKILTTSRHALSLFQHHDGITGTARNHVVIDYAEKMRSAIRGCQQVVQLCAHVLLNGFRNETPDKEAVYYNIADGGASQDGHYEIIIGYPEISSKKIVVYNSLTFSRREVVTFYISTPFVEVRDSEGNRIKCQLSPIFEYGPSMSQTKYQLSFASNVPPLSLTAYTINALLETDVPSETVFSAVTILNHYGEIKPPVGFRPEVTAAPKEFSLQNGRVVASFGKLGLLKSMKIDGKIYPVHLDFAKYGVAVRKNSETSGAYLFVPDGEAVPVPAENVVVNVIEGPIVSSVSVQLPYVRHTAVLYNTTGGDGLGIELHNLVDITKTRNFELVMRLSTNINSSDEFYTDDNGYQILKRKRFKKLPLQANYYPIPTMAYIEDAATRLTITTATPLGCSSLTPGRIEVMLDRRLNQDDNLGLGQGVQDNRPIEHVFRILIETKRDNCETGSKQHPAGFSSIAAHVTSQTLLNPLVKLSKSIDDDSESISGGYRLIDDFGIDYSMPVIKSNVRFGDRNYFGIVVFRRYLDVCFDDEDILRRFRLSDGSVSLEKLVPENRRKYLRKATLSFLRLENLVGNEKSIELCPMEMRAFVF
ncbi:alpha-mannosidase 2 [Diorhabda sublineata]|uniref:alpha-mannosidase 2 n=1 Tax=Diorhabda sublineata TaxID=1163346 RepID=UPI0024E15BDF|nr:alpha-mannosidase 2 [Diorhabda sublineata]